MEQIKFQKLLEKSVQDADLYPGELPCIDLYMDQIITMMDERLSANKRQDSDKILTKTMINNYSKEGLIPPVKGKKYGKGHITQMLLIYALKGTMSIQEIKSFFTWAEQCKEEMAEEEVIAAYSAFLDNKNYQRKLLPEQISCMLEETDCDISTKEGLFRAVLMLSSMSRYLKKMVENILDEEIIPTAETEFLP